MNYWPEVFETPRKISIQRRHEVWEKVFIGFFFTISNIKICTKKTDKNIKLQTFVLINFFLNDCTFLFDVSMKNDLFNDQRKFIFLSSPRLRLFSTLWEFFCPSTYEDAASVGRIFSLIKLLDCGLITVAKQNDSTTVLHPAALLRRIELIEKVVE
jgi:hypothetical protein